MHSAPIAPRPSAGCFSFKRGAAGKATHIKHISAGEKALPEHVFISKSFSLYDNCSDADARVELPPCTFKCCDFFGADEPPNTTIVRQCKPRCIYQVATDIYAQYQEQIRQDSVGEMSDKSKLLLQSSSERRKRSAATARDARTRATIERKQRRKVVLA